jgi:hypothetical protein
VGRDDCGYGKDESLPSKDCWCATDDTAAVDGPGYVAATFPPILRIGGPDGFYRVGGRIFLGLNVFQNLEAATPTKTREKRPPEEKSARLHAICA